MNKKILIGLIGLVLIASGLTVAYLQGMIKLNNPSRDAYPVRGVDVSRYQGEIDWTVLAAEDINFAFIKATEGSTFVDERFTENWEAAGKTELLVGAYHFFSYGSPGKAQAEHFINTVPLREGMLPPVIDVEFYGGNERNPPDRGDVQRELSDMIDALEAHYGVKPILYAIGRSYDLYLADSFDGCPIWIRNVFFPPTLKDGRAFHFWQYTDREKLAGYQGDEKFIDMNVFMGTLAELKEMCIVP